ncbi:MAG: PAS domain S-box protein [Pedobacter sp.]|nr:MAG: PAS domain S-box protein [Pedobacter sp.]
MRRFIIYLITVYLLLGLIWLIVGSWLISRFVHFIDPENLIYVYHLKNLLFLVVSVTSIVLIMRNRYSKLLSAEQSVNKELSDSRKQLSKILQDYNYVNKATNDCIWDYNIIKDELRWVSGYLELFGYEDGGTIKDSFWHMQKIHPEDRDRTVSLFQDLLKRKDQRWNVEYRYICSDGKYKYVKDRGYLLLNEQLEPFRMVGAIQDIHQIKIYQQQLELQNEKLKEIAWLNSHEIRRPLSNITGVIPLIKDSLDDRDSLLQLIDVLELSTEELEQSIQKVNAQAK